MASLWRVVCTGPGPSGRQRRRVDRGPLHPERDRAERFAAFLRATGLYESVEVVSTTLPLPGGPGTAGRGAADRADPFA